MKVIALTMGEPGGVGPEVALKAVAAPGMRRFVPVLVGDISVFREAGGLIRFPFDLRPVQAPGPSEAGVVQVVHTGAAGPYRPGRPTRAGGRASVDAVKRAVEMAVQGRVSAIVTAPLSKEALRKAGYQWPGHTEMLAELTGTKEYAMMLTAGPGRGRRLRVILVTIHRALADVPALVTRRAVGRTLRLAVRAAEMLGIREPRIAVAGLNPHAGEGGLFGREERTAIIPAIKDARGRGLPVSGPYPADTLFHRAYRGEFDIVVAMYHDQGLVPLKLVGFERGVNVTVGLPLVRTSPDHGTAYDIAWRGVADPRSMMEAVRVALMLRHP